MENKRIDLQQMSEPELAEILRRETEKEVPDDDLVLQILRILEERDGDKPVELSPQSQAAWENYRSKVKGRARAKKPWLRMNWIIKAASLVLLVGIPASAFLPKQATAGSFWKILTSWTDDFFRYENIGAETTEPEEYVFESDNPGLVQVYEAVVEELGITEPVVVQWLPEGNELVEIKILDTPAKNAVNAHFQNGEKVTVLKFEKMKMDLSSQYFKTEAQVIEYETNGIIHNFIRNDGAWTVSWANQNIKCSIYVDCQEETLRQIIKSIY